MAVDMNRMMRVTNRSAGVVAWRIPELNLRRSLVAGESISVPYSELVKLSYQPGGRSLMEGYLFITGEGAEQAMNEMNVVRTPESYMTRADVVALLQTGSYDELSDCLNFAPAGVIDILKDEAVKMRLNDMKKREMIKDKLGFDVSKALEANEPDPEDGKTAAAGNTTATATADAPVRKTSGSKYKVVNTTEE